MTVVAALAFCILLGMLTLLQIALIVVAPLGHLAWAGQDRLLRAKKRAGSILAIVLYLVFAIVALERVAVIELIRPTPVVDVAMWVIAGYSALSVAVNAILRSKPERYRRFRNLPPPGLGGSRAQGPIRALPNRP